ncbi:protein RD3 [Aplochiton taeniatus]
MFPWSAVFSLEPKVPGQRSAEELVTNTLMLELGAMVKRTERIRLERATEGRRRRRSSSSTADYSWLASAANPPPYELTARDLVELQDLCARVPPPQCGPLIVRFRKMVKEQEPEVHEVPRLFRTVLRDSVEGDDFDELAAAGRQKQRSQSLSFVSFRSKIRTANPMAKGGAMGGSRGDLQDGGQWYEEDEEVEADEALAARAAKRGRSKSMPDITPVEQSALG